MDLILSVANHSKSIYHRSHSKTDSMADSTMAALNQRHLDGLKHPDSGRAYSRSEKGLRLVLGQKPSSLKSWELTYYLFGKKTRYILGHFPSDFNLHDARIERDRLKSLVKQGICPKQEAERLVMVKKLAAAQRITFADLRQRYDEQYLLKKPLKSRPEVIRVLRTKFEAWDGLEPQEINRMMITERLDQIELDGPVIRNRSHSYLRKMLSFAVEKSIVDINNAKGISKLPEQSKKRYLSADEIRYFWDEIEKQNFSLSTVIALRLMLVTGQRGGEILTMKPEHVDGEWWTQPDSKNGLKHRTYLTPMAVNLITQAEEASPNKHYVFGSGSSGHANGGTLSKALKRWGKRKLEPMAIPAFTPHDLRRTMATNLGNMEIDRFAQDKILNHVDRTVGGIYDVGDYDQLKLRTMPLWETRLKLLLENNQENNVVSIRG